MFSELVNMGQSSVGSDMHCVFRAFNCFEDDLRDSPMFIQ